MVGAKAVTEKDHVTARKEERYTGSLDGVPRSYQHSKCGAGTGMPEEIIRSYLVRVDIYSSETFCTGCNDYVPHRECFWIETGQSLDEYMQDLRRKQNGE